MADETKVQAEAAAEAPAKVAEAVADTAEKVVKESAGCRQARRLPRPRRGEAGRRQKTRRSRGASNQAAAPQSSYRPAQERRRGPRKDQHHDQQQFLQRLRRGPGVRALPDPIRRRQRAQPGARQAQPEGRRGARRSHPRQCRGAGRGRPYRRRGAKRDRPGRVAKSRENIEQASDAIQTLAEAKSPTEFSSCRASSSVLRSTASYPKVRSSPSGSSCSPAKRFSRCRTAPRPMPSASTRSLPDSPLLSQAATGGRSHQRERPPFLWPCTPRLALRHFPACHILEHDEPLDNDGRMTRTATASTRSRPASRPARGRRPRSPPITRC